MRRSILIFGIVILIFLLSYFLPFFTELQPIRHWAPISLGIIALIVIAVFFEFAEKAGGAKEISMTAMLAALSSVIRIPFAAIPSVQPSSFVIASSGYVFGPVSGFMVGAMTAIVSNFFLGMGPWTFFQMFAWGLMGASFAWAGRFIRVFGPRSRVLFLAGLGFGWGYIFGFITNIWSFSAFGLPLTWESLVTLQLASLPFDTMHAVSNAAFFLIFGKVVLRILERFRERFFIS
jgi:energy-coupling factor transport system substrate-specific component